MAKVSISFEDNKGNTHATPEAAAQADIADALSTVAVAGLTPAIAKAVLEKRGEIEAAYRDYDIMKDRARVS